MNNETKEFIRYNVTEFTKKVALVLVVAIILGNFGFKTKFQRRYERIKVNNEIVKISEQHQELKNIISTERNCELESVEKLIASIDKVLETTESDNYLLNEEKRTSLEQMRATYVKLAKFKGSTKY